MDTPEEMSAEPTTDNRTPSVPDPQAEAYADEDPIVTVLVDACNGFNELNSAAML